MYYSDTWFNISEGTNWDGCKINEIKIHVATEIKYNTLILNYIKNATYLHFIHISIKVKFIPLLPFLQNCRLRAAIVYSFHTCNGHFSSSNSVYWGVTQLNYQQWSGNSHDIVRMDQWQLSQATPPDTKYDATQQRNGKSLLPKFLFPTFQFRVLTNSKTANYAQFSCTTEDLCQKHKCSFKENVTAIRIVYKGVAHFNKKQMVVKLHLLQIKVTTVKFKHRYFKSECQWTTIIERTTEISFSLAPSALPIQQMQQLKHTVE